MCNLCTGAVQFVLERDRADRFDFASLQSAAARRLLGEAGAPAVLPDSIVLLDEQGLHTRSDAALRIAARLRQPWPLLRAFRILPKGLRDWAYDFVARRRHRWFGTRDACLVPTPELRGRFLDAGEPPAQGATTLASTPDVAGSPSPLGSLALRFVLAYLFIVIFPFPLDSLPGIPTVTEAYSQLVHGFVSWVARVAFGITITVFPNGSGDTTYNYVEVATFAALALVAALAATALARGRPVGARTLDLMRTYVRYYLAAVMLGYGFHKVLPLQFPAPGPDRLILSYGDSSPMGLLWTFMGASKPYMMFGGLGEVVGGLLLLWRRTTLLGSLVASGVLLNIVMLNFCYDVPVKLFSSLLLFLALFLLWPDLGRLLNLLLWNRAAAPAILRPFPIERPWLRRTALAFKILLVFSITVLAFWQNYQTLWTYGPWAPRKPLQGVYRVRSFVRDGVADRELPDATRWVRVGINQDWAMAIQRADGRGQRYRVVMDETDKTLSLTARDRPEPVVLAYQEPEARVLVVEGRFEDGTITARLEREDDAPFLLTSRGFRWINEYPFNR